MRVIDERIECGDPQKDYKEYHHFILSEKNNFFRLKERDEVNDFEYPESNYRYLEFPMNKLPEFIGNISTVFYTPNLDNTLKIFNYKNFEISVSIHIDIYRVGDLKELTLGMENLEKKYDIQLIRLDWPETIPWDVTKRVMPASLVWLIDNLKKLYNQWQEEHPEEPRLE